MRFISIFLLLTLFFSISSAALRRVKIGDPIPEMNGIDLKTKNTKLIFYLNSSKTRSIKFIEKLAPEFENKKNIELYFIDTSSSAESKLKNTLDKIKFKKKIITDPDRKLFNSLGIIIIPTLLFLNEDNTLHSIITGYKSNLSVFFRSNLEALLKGEKSGNVFAKSNLLKKQREISKLLKQGFRLFINKQFDIALSLYKKCSDLSTKNINPALGIGYSLLSLGKIDEGIEHFTNLKSREEHKRVLFAYYYSRSLKENGEDILQNLAKYALFETRYFTIIFEAAKKLEKEGKQLLSSNLYKHSYKLLLRFYRRNK